MIKINNIFIISSCIVLILLLTIETITQIIEMKYYKKLLKKVQNDKIEVVEIRNKYDE